MSRSYRRSPFTSYTCCESEKKDKRFANRKLRRINKMLIKSGLAEKLKKMREVSSVWDFGKDGKYWIGEDDPWWKKYKRK